MKIAGLILVLSLTSYAGSADWVLPAGLVSWWPAETNAEDAVDGNSGILRNGTGFADGKIGPAYDFNGINQYVEIANNSNLNPAGCFSIECWIYPRQDRIQVIMSKWTDSPSEPNQRSYGIVMLPNRALNFGISDAAHQWDAPFHLFNTTNNVLTLNAWNHVVAVYDQPVGTRRIYVNGVKVAERKDPPIIVLKSTSRFSIGAQFSEGPPGYFFDGLIDEMRFYSQALSAEEIQILYRYPGPALLVSPQSQIGFWGKSVNFGIEAVGLEPLSYQWQKDGQPIPGATQASFVLTNVQMTDAGSYSVVVTNQFGVAVSEPAILTFAPAGVSINLYSASYIGIRIEGVIGLTYGIQYNTDLTNTHSWRGLTNIFLDWPAQLWFDSQLATQPSRFYRVVPGPINFP